MYDRLNDFGKVVENRYGSAVLNRRSFLFLKTEELTACSHNFGKVFWDRLRLKINLRIGTRISEQPFIMKLGIPSSPIDLVGLNRFIAL
jgi:hypothetical protein